MGAMDKYLAGLARPEREALQHLRELVHAELPQVLEVTSYNLPGFAVDQRRSSRIVGGFAAGRRYRSWYTVSGRTVERFATKLAGFETTKGSIHFTPEAMLPDALVRSMLHDRLGTIRPPVDDAARRRGPQPCRLKAVACSTSAGSGRTPV